GREHLRRRLSKRSLLGLPVLFLGATAVQTARSAAAEPIVSDTAAAAAARGAPRARSVALARAVLRDRGGWLGRMAIVLLTLSLGGVVAWQVRAAVGGPAPPAGTAAACGGGCHANP